MWLTRSVNEMRNVGKEARAEVYALTVSGWCVYHYHGSAARGRRESARGVAR